MFPRRYFAGRFFAERYWPSYAEESPPTVPGAELALSGERTHYALSNERLHYSVGEE